MSDDYFKPSIPCYGFRMRYKNMFTGPQESRGLHGFKIHCVLEFAHDGDHTDPTGRTW